MAKNSKPVRRPRRAGQPLTVAETLALLKAARALGTRDWCMCLMAYRHGMRASEVCGLRMDDLNVKDRTVRVRRLKGSRTTVQPLFEARGQPLLNEYRAVRQWIKERGWNPSPFVFTSQRGARLDRSQFFRRYRQAAVTAGLPVEKRHPHCLKHSLGSHMIEANLTGPKVQQALGHSSFSSTLRYIKVSDRQASDAMAQAAAELFR